MLIKKEYVEMAENLAVYPVEILVAKMRILVAFSGRITVHILDLSGV
jgi:hypothetical protein